MTSVNVIEVESTAELYERYANQSEKLYRWNRQPSQMDPR